MDPAQALRELTDVSSQIEAACLLDADGTALASTLPDEGAASRFAAAAAALLAAARRVSAPAPGGVQLVQLEAATLEGSVFVVLDGDRAVAAATKPEPTVGLVFYDLKSCLRASGTPGDDDGRPRPSARKRQASTSESAA
jgi:predicted regulator of Ras-like GTPase activity (Roadblock/LC7/MglB family)